MRTRGQATVELALGAVVFVGVLMAGIHLAEYAQLSLKVQDAQTFAVWEAANRRVQSRDVDGRTGLAPFNRTLDDTTGVGPRAKRRFADFNELESVSGGTIVRRALTQGSGVDVDCFRENSLTFRATSTAQGIMLDEGGLRCRSRAEVRAIRVPERFLQRDEGGWFENPIVRRQPIRVCGMGLPVNGQCRGSLALLTNDWALTSESETAECKLDCDSSPYRGMIRSMWGGGGGAGAAFATQYAGAAPTSAGEFHFSYSGVESGMIQKISGEGLPEFVTGGAGLGMVPRMTRPSCFLGKPCP
ncbi:MAG TPA: hypothetical protein VGD87_13675 [Archangium sp.]